MSAPYAPGEGFEVARKEDKCTQCKERDLLQNQVECSTWTAHSKSLSMHWVHFSSSPATSNPSAGVCIWTTHRRQFLLKADATRVSFSSFSVLTVGSILMRVGRPQEYFLLCRSCPSEGAWWAVLECRSCRSVDYASLFVVPEC